MWCDAGHLAQVIEAGLETYLLVLYRQWLVLMVCFFRLGGWWAIVVMWHHIHP